MTRIGYACIILGNEKYKLKNLRLKSLSEEKLKCIISHNLKALEKMIDYNILMGINLFRISSDIIPFGGHKANNLDWVNLFDEDFSRISKKIKSNNIRVSMHPGQYTVLNSPKGEVVNNAVSDLIYHAMFLDALDLDKRSKMVLHIGGIYNDKKSAINRFIKEYKNLDESVKKRLIIENDDKSYNIEDLLYISSKTNCPVVFDNLHHQINKPNQEKDIYSWIKLTSKTWMKDDGRQKLHFSIQRKEAKIGSHSNTIYLDEFLWFYKNLENKDVDIMLEVKDKNLSAIKINNIINKTDISHIEKEWARYKYFVLSKSQKLYLEIRDLLKNKLNLKIIEFYKIIEKAYDLPYNESNFINSIDHIWGYFKDICTETEKKKYLRLKEDKKSIIKNFLLKLADKYNIEYLLNSYFFYI